MMLKSVRIRNYRSIKDVTLNCDGLTILVGANGSGKSSFLQAIELFGVEKPAITEEDYYNKLTRVPISITVTFTDLSNLIKTQFEDYVINGEITVIRIFKWDDGKCISTYCGVKLQNPRFDLIRSSDAKTAQQEYNKLRDENGYDLPAWISQSAAKTTLKKWEADHSDKCKKCQDDGTYFKQNRGFLKSIVRFLPIEPVRDAAEDIQDKKSSMSDLMELLVMSKLEEDDNIRKFKDSMQKRYRKLIDTVIEKKMTSLKESMSRTVGEFAPGTGVDLSWGMIEMHMRPKVETRLKENEYWSVVSKAGHGLQRVFIMSLLQHLSEAQIDKADTSTDASPVTVLMIDEPELYQHPNRQRHMSQGNRSPPPPSEGAAAVRRESGRGGGRGHGVRL